VIYYNGYFAHLWINYLKVEDKSCVILMGNFLPTFQLQKHIWTTLALEHKFASQSTTSMSTQMCKFIFITSI
jgi:hypothetical protein